MKTKETHRAGSIAASPKVSAHRAKGFSLIEVTVAVGIAVILMATAFPIMNTTMTSMHLGSAASSLAGAIQDTRYMAISLGCPYTLTVLPSQNSYQLATEPISGTPPACGASFVNVGNPVPFASSDISTTFNTPILLNPSGTVAAVGSSTLPQSFSIPLTSYHSAATKHVTVTGVGDVKVTAP
jgi:prepilin-type N-terminal cleavage/methylation domain-containing protein